MNKFTGTTLECINELVKNGWNGTVVDSFGKEYSAFEDHGHFTIKSKEKRGMQTVIDMSVHLDSTLEKSATYFPPEPIWKGATPGQALDAYMLGKNVQTTFKIGGFPWIKIDKLDKSWALPDYIYRIEVPS